MKKKALQHYIGRLQTRDTGARLEHCCFINTITDSCLLNNNNFSHFQNIHTVESAQSRRKVGDVINCIPLRLFPQLMKCCHMHQEYFDTQQFNFRLQSLTASSQVFMSATSAFCRRNVWNPSITFNLIIQGECLKWIMFGPFQNSEDV